MPKARSTSLRQDTSRLCRRGNVEGFGDAMFAPWILNNFTEDATCNQLVKVYFLTIN